jgi:hypothetical protein
VPLPRCCHSSQCTQALSEVASGRARGTAREKARKFLAVRASLAM